MLTTDPLYIKSTIPAGISGDWILEKFDVIGDAVESALPPGFPDCDIRRPGKYTRLRRGNTVFMTDLYDEWWTQRIAIREALKRGGHLLITGLGLGLILESILNAPDSPVEHITVVDFSKDVIKLVVPHLTTLYPGKLDIVWGDAFTWRPPEGAHYDLVWHDIWPNPYAPDAITEMEQLEARYAACCDWQGCWPNEYLWIFQQRPWQNQWHHSHQTQSPQDAPDLTTPHEGIPLASEQ